MFIVTFIDGSILGIEDPVAVPLAQVKVPFVGVSVVPGHQTPALGLAVKDLTLELPVPAVCIDALESSKVDS